ncbi:MAG TPA: ATP-binding cassette domain-containing protein, partial [Thermomicrobiales bacterium]|nr:ATP-binding cassette domain-containing protein [Thermomicrobiales bacterium]
MTLTLDRPSTRDVTARTHRATDTVLTCVDLTKKFDSFTAVNHLSFDLKAGEVLGFLGPNGAGKSTTVGMILGLIRPTAGKIFVHGQSIEADPAIIAQHIGAIIENPAFYPYLSGRDNLRALMLMAGKRDEARIEELLKLVNMHDRADKAFKTFSLGMKQRLGIAATLITNPSIVILDEPTNGLDPAGQREIRALIPRLAQEGHAILLASHMLHEVEQVSNRVAIVRQGTLVQEGTVSEMLRTGGGHIEILVAPEDLAAAVEVLTGLVFVTKVEVENGQIKVEAPDNAGRALNENLVRRGIYAAGITLRKN